MNGKVRELLHEQLDNLPDEVVEQIADFTLFVIARRGIAPIYSEWDDDDWKEFALRQFSREEDEIVYTLDDAEEVFHL